MSYRHARIIKMACSGIVAGGVLLGGAALAEEEAVKLDKERVTGSLIKRIDVEGATPLFVIKAEEIKNQGFQSVQEVLDALPQNLGGSVDASFTFGFTPGASSIDLRGFGNGRSLVLVDGRRMPIYPVGLSGTDNFVDLSQIPLVIVDRIEVLTDGASAIYGADAISGVINIITRKDYDGMQASVAYGDTTNGGYEHNRVQFTGGVTNATSNVTLMVEHWENDPVWAVDRDYAESDIADPRGFYSIGGSSFIRYDDFSIIQDPNCGTPDGPLGGKGIPDQNIPIITGGDLWCGFNRTAFRQLWADVKRDSITGRVNHEFSNDIGLFFSAGFTRKEIGIQLEPNFYGGQLFGYGSGPDAIIPGAQGFVSPGAPNDPSADLGNTEGGVFVRRLVEWGPRSQDITEDIYAYVLGFNGTLLNDYEWEASVAYNKIDYTEKSPNIILSVLNNYIDTGELDLFKPVPQEIVDASSYLRVREAFSKNTTFNFLVSGDTNLELNGGMVAFAALVDWANEEYNDQSDPITTLGDNFDGASSGGGERDHYGIGAEFLFPILENWEVNLAGRFDNYDDDSDVGSAFSPKISTAYRPIDSLLLRASWGRSFRAPDMQRLFGAETIVFDTVNDPVTGLQVPSVELRVGGNVELEEEEGENINLGVVWEPLEDLTLKVDWYNIELENIVSEPTAQFLLNSCGADQTGPFCDQIHRDAAGTLTGGYIELGAQNLSFQEITGVDFTVEYDLDVGEWGDFKFTGLLAYVDSLETKLDDDSPTVENIGIASIPEYRFGGIVDWNKGDWGASLRVDWIDEMCGVNGFECGSDEFIDSYTMWNGTVRYDSGDWGRVLFGVHNIFDEDPAKDPTNFQWPWFFNNGGFSNPLGRTWTVEYTVDF